MSKTKIEIGGVYSVAQAKGFGIVKVLAYQPEIDCVYARSFGALLGERSKAEHITESQRDPMVMLEKFGWGIGALPVTSRVFEYWQPELMFVQNITEEEHENLSECYGVAKPWDDLKFP